MKYTIKWILITKMLITSGTDFIKKDEYGRVYNYQKYDTTISYEWHEKNFNSEDSFVLFGLNLISERQKGEIGFKNIYETIYSIDSITFIDSPKFIENETKHN